MVEENQQNDYTDSNKERLRMFIFEIHSTPRPQKQTILGKGRCYDPSKMTKRHIQWQISPHAPKELIHGPIEMHLTFYMPIPKHTPKRQKNSMIANVLKHYKRPDVDNLAYIVTNAMKGLIYDDDSQICRLILEKKYGEDPKTVVKILEV